MKPISSCRLALALSAVAAAGLTAGCSTYEVKLDAISQAAPAIGNRTSYTIQSKNPAVETDSLRYQEAAERIKTALSGHGLWEAPPTVKADMIVELDYDIEPAQIAYKPADVPVYVPTCPVVGQMAGRELVGHTTAAVPTVVCEKHLSVSCRGNETVAEGRPAPELWRIRVSIEDERTDLRECLPVLASVVMDQIGKDSGGVTTKRVEPNDCAVAFINKGI